MAQSTQKLTPMFRQYQSVKAQHPNAILFFRMGDFYEMFYEDAEAASRVLELTLTARGKGTDNVVPMCGFPHHQLDAYTAKLVRSGRRVAVCDQTEDPRKVKGLVKREVVRVVTPGTLTDPDQLDAKRNAWLAAVVSGSKQLGAAFVDASTGELIAWESRGDQPWQELSEQLRAFAPREIVYPEGLPWSDAFRAEQTRDALLTEQDPFSFAADSAERLLLRQLGVSSLDGFGLRGRTLATAAAGGLLAYVRDTQKNDLQHIDRVQLHEPARFVLLDPATRRNLELERGLRDGGRAGSLLEAIDRTVTASGGRLLHRWLLEPLLESDAIRGRHDAVEELLRRSEVRRAVRQALDGVYDIERLLARVVGRSANPRDLVSLRRSLMQVPAVLSAIETMNAAVLRATVDGLDPCGDVAQRLETAIVDEPPIGLRDGGYMRPGFNAELDELHKAGKEGRAYIASLEGTEKEKTGITSLKVRFNKVFGYYIEVSRSNLHLVPEHYQRKQTIANGERYITPELKEHESKVLGAQERIDELEYDLFVALREEIAAHAGRLKEVARAMAVLDVLAGFAEQAAHQDYCRPAIDDERRLCIQGGRHPVVEQHLVEHRFVPNDTELDSDRDAVGILTGPNMGGKSTYLRQVALIVLMAQAGSFVPAEAVELGVVDRIFCRVGASDSLSEGQSTFMVEMTETANILHHASARSLVLLDEIGRGTSTFDGLSIAWAVVEHLAANEPAPPRTLFATHYHELTELSVELQGVKNYRMAVRERGEDVVFMHRVEDGASDRSYGIQVARLAGVPPAVVQRAREILGNLESDEYGGDGLPRRARRGNGAAARKNQPSLFAGFGDAPDEPAQAPADPAAAEVLAELRALDPDRTTPLEALQKLSAWSRRLPRD